MKFESIKRWFIRLWHDFEISWAKAGEAQMRIDEAKLRVGHPFYRSQFPEKKNDQFKNL